MLRITRWLAIHTYSGSSNTSGPASEAPSGPTCLPDGSHTGDYGQCCSRSWKSDNSGHYICCTQNQNC